MALHRITPIGLIKTRGSQMPSVVTGLHKVASGRVSAGRSAHPADKSQAQAKAMENKREIWRQDATMPVNRVAMVISDVPGGGPETGFVHARHTSAIVWDRHSQQWVPATYAAEPVSANKLARVVKPTQASNRHVGGS